MDVTSDHLPGATDGERAGRIWPRLVAVGGDSGAGRVVLENGATRALAELFHQAVVGDYRRQARVLADGVRFRDRRARDGGYELTGIDQLLDRVQVIVGFGSGDVSVEPVATRGEVDALVCGNHRQVPLHAVVHLDHNGRISEIDLFEAAEQLAAVRLLDERFRLGRAAGSDAWGVQVDLLDALNRRDLDGLRERLDPSCAVVDHRPLGWGRLRAKGFVNLFPALFLQTPDVGWVVVRDLRIRPSVTLSTIDTVRNPADPSSRHESAFVIFVAHEERAARLEVFASEHRVDAEARFDELAIELGE